MEWKESLVFTDLREGVGGAVTGPFLLSMSRLTRLRKACSAGEERELLTRGKVIRFLCVLLIFCRWEIQGRGSLAFRRN